MAPPLRPGDRVAWLSADGDGVRVEEATVLTVEREGMGWTVETDSRREVVDHRGERTAGLLPIDDELARDFARHDGEPFVVQSTAQEIEADLDPFSIGTAFERELGHDDPDRDHGPEAMTVDQDEDVTTDEVAKLLEDPRRALNNPGCRTRRGAGAGRIGWCRDGLIRSARFWMWSRWPGICCRRVGCSRSWPGIVGSCSRRRCSRICSSGGSPVGPGGGDRSVIVLQTLHGLSDTEAVEAVTFDLRWKAACGLAVTAAGTGSTADRT